MGVLYDYFRASDDATVVDLLAANGDWYGATHADGSAVDVVEAKSLDPDVVVGKVVAHIRDVPWSPGTMGTGLVEPAEDEGPWVVRIADEARDTLADLPDDRFRELAAWWATIEEFARWSRLDDEDVEMLREKLAELVGLARRARAADDRLYCWICV
ncbi:hypothetical protein GCM10009682_38020 [Luedemannella flava]|uniref:DUF1877 family protein n=1 Tax=Luedemannella flava TaxID=349316 RepID=A0ABP4YER9_9ACTN